MIGLALIDELRTILRIGEAQTAFDSEIHPLIDAAKADLKLSGVSEAKTEDEEDPLIKRAITIYVKAHFGWDNPDAERLQQSYDMLKMHLTLSQEYTGDAS